MKSCGRQLTYPDRRRFHYRTMTDLRKVRHSFVGVSADAQTNSVLEMKAGEKVFSLVSQPNENRDTG